MMGDLRRPLQFLDGTALTTVSFMLAVSALALLAPTSSAQTINTPLREPVTESAPPPIDPSPSTVKNSRNDRTLDVEPPTTDVPRESCVTAECHSGKKAQPFVHGPIYANACDTCHTLTDPLTHSYQAARTREQLCVFCHEFDTPEGSMKHEPFQSGECLSCHDPHGGAGPNHLRSEQYADMCTSCHAEFAVDSTLIHGPVLAGACGACHEPHSAEHRNLLAADGKDMCLRCHAEMDIKMETMRLVHAPVEEDCQLCHDPHGTNNASLLIDEPMALCLSCHENIAHTIDTALTQHGAITTERTCLNCHDAHASDHPRLLRDDVMALCFECHNTEIELEDGTRLANMKAIIETGSSLHGAIAERSCVACHEIHGGDRSRLLAREYPSTLYYPFQESGYALCFNCHDKALVTHEQTTTVTAFRNGAMNLHYVHVKRDQKGRTCRVCHDSHAARREQHINDTIPFGPGGWELPIRYERVEEGGRCAAGCHRSLVYNRSIPVVYPFRPNNEDTTNQDMLPIEREEPQR